MIADEKFKLRKSPTVECSASTSMNFAPTSEWTKDDSRITIRLRPDDDDDERRLTIRMSQAEALVLGNHLVKYGEMNLAAYQSQQGLTPVNKLTI